MRHTVRAALLERIIDGRLAPGDAVSPPAVAQELDISATPIREALVDLANEGFIRSVPRRGFFVAPLSTAEVREVYPLIWTVEALVLRDAPPTSSDLLALEALNDRFTAATSPTEHVQLDREWHRLLLARSGKKMWLTLLDNLKQRAARYELAYMAWSGAVPTSGQQHRAIVEALRHNDLDAAARHVEANWQIGIEFLVPWLEKRAEGVSIGRR